MCSGRFNLEAIRRLDGITEHICAFFISVVKQMFVFFLDKFYLKKSRAWFLDMFNIVHGSNEDLSTYIVCTVHMLDHIFTFMRLICVSVALWIDLGLWFTNVYTNLRDVLSSHHKNANCLAKTWNLLSPHDDLIPSQCMRTKNSTVVKKKKYMHSHCHAHSLAYKHKRTHSRPQMSHIFFMIHLFLLSRYCHH